MIEKYIAISIYLIILAVITYLSAKGKGVGNFLFASHDVDWKSLSLSFFSSVFSSYNIVVTLTFAFVYGPYIILVFLGVIAAFWGIYLIAKSYRDIVQKEKFNNIVDFFKHRFDSKVATVFHLTFIAALFLFIVLQLFINTTVFSELMSWGKYISALFVGVVVFLYIMIGGLKTEIFTDIFQGILMLLIVGLAFMVDTSSITTNTVNSIITNKTLLIGALSLAAVQFLSLLIQPEMWQRVVAAKNTYHLKKGLFTGGLLFMLMVVPIMTIGMAARASGVAQSSSSVFYDILNTSAPEWFMPFLTVAIFAAFMSTLDSSLFAISSQLGKYGILVKKSEGPQEVSTEEKEKDLAKKIRVCIIGVLLIALASSLFLGNFLQGVFSLVSLLTIISTTTILSIIFKLSSNETFAVAIVGIAAFLFAFLGNYITSEAITTLYPSFALIGYALIQTLLIRIYNHTHLSSQT